MDIFSSQRRVLVMGRNSLVPRFKNRLISCGYVFSMMQGSCDGLKYACAPLPPYLESGDPEEMEESGMKIPVYDICFHLLKLYCDR